MSGMWPHCCLHPSQVDRGTCSSMVAAVGAQGVGGVRLGEGLRGCIPICPHQGRNGNRVLLGVVGCGVDEMEWVPGSRFRHVQEDADFDLRPLRWVEAGKEGDSVDASGSLGWMYPICSHIQQYVIKPANCLSKLSPVFLCSAVGIPMFVVFLTLEVWVQANHHMI